MERLGGELLQVTGQLVEDLEHHGRLGNETRISFGQSQGDCLSTGIAYPPGSFDALEDGPWRWAALRQHTTPTSGPCHDPSSFRTAEVMQDLRLATTDTAERRLGASRMVFVSHRPVRTQALLK